MTSLLRLPSLCQLALALCLLGFASAEAGEAEVVLADFVKWLQDNGVTALGYPTSPLLAVVDHLPENSGKQRADIYVVANQDIKKGDLIITLPSKVLINSRKLVEEGYSPYEKNINPGWYHYSTLAAWLLKEKAKGSDSFFAPYINILPSYVPLPVFYEPELVKELEYEKIISDIQSIKPHWLEEYKLCDPEKIANASYEEFSWAMSILYSRCFSASVDASEESKYDAVLMPLADMLNHDDHYQAQWTVASYTENCTFVALSDVSKGDHVFTTYGRKTSDEVAMTYGFVLPVHHYDAVILYKNLDEVLTHYKELGDMLEFDELDHQWAQHVAQEATKAVETALLENESIQSGHEGSEYSVRSGAKIDAKLVAAIAAIFLHKEHQEEPLYENVANVSITLGSNLALEECEHYMTSIPSGPAAFQMAVYMVHKRVSDILYGYKTTYEEDKADLEKLEDCKVTRGAFDSDSGCKKVWRSHIQEWQTILRLRVAKKAVLKEVSLELQSSCWGMGDSSETDDHESGDQEEELLEEDMESTGGAVLLEPTEIEWVEAEDEGGDEL